MGECKDTTAYFTTKKNRAKNTSKLIFKYKLDIINLRILNKLNISLILKNNEI